jgi:nucleoside-diphosphate-sugar epimerase
MKVLVTGSNGFLGAALVERLLAHGETDIRCFVRSGSDRKRLEAVQQAHPDAALEIFEGTLATVPGAMAALEGIGIVYHVAAGMSGSSADLFLSSVVTSKNLLEAMERTACFVKVVLISSFGVYGTASLPRGAVLNEDSPLEAHPEKRDLYSYAKWRQEKLFREHQERHGFPLVILRPGVIYGPSGGGISARVGLSLFGVFLHLGGGNRLPLSYVENCAEAVASAGRSEEAVGKVFNVHDDDLPTCGQFLRRYRREVRRLRVVPIPYGATMLLSRLVAWYHVRSKGQLPAVFTPYKTATSWKATHFDNSRLKSLGWQQIVPTDEGIRRTFAHLRANAN